MQPQTFHHFTQAAYTMAKVSHIARDFHLSDWDNANFGLYEPTLEPRSEALDLLHKEVLNTTIEEIGKPVLDAHMVLKNLERSKSLRSKRGWGHH